MVSRKNFAILIVFLLVCADLNAQSPPFSWASPRSMALGGVTATGFDEPANMHTNPASLFEIERFTVSAGVAGNMMRGRVKPEGGKVVETEASPMFSPSITAGINFGARLVSAGISLNTFDAFQVRLPDDAATRYQGTNITLFSGGLDLAFGFMPFQDWAFGVKAGLMGSHSQWERRINPFPDSPDPAFDMKWKLKMKSLSDISFLGGVLWSPSYRFKTGLTYRPQMRYDMDTEMFTSLPENMGGVTISSGTRNVRLVIPQEAKMGFHWIASERIDLYLDIGWTEYSSMESRVIRADDPKPPYIPAETTLPVRMKDVWHGHIGIEYMVSGFVTLRAGGFYYTESGQPGYGLSLVPVSAQQGITAGIGLDLFEWHIDASAGQAQYESADITGSNLPFPLTAESEYSRYFAAVSVTYSF
jgi:long-subunit fatty acid transport protein